MSDGTSVENLVLLAQQGDSSAFRRLVAEFTFLVRERAKLYLYSGIESEDLMQEGMIGFIRAVKTYDSSFGTSFRTYASLCVDRSIITAVNKTLAKHIVPKSAVVPLDDVGDFKSAALPSAEHEVMYKLDMDELMGGLTDTLSEFEIRVFRLLLCGISYKAISEKLGCSEKSVDNAIQRIRRKLS